MGLENRVLRRMFGLMRGEVAGGWRRLHNEELHNLYTAPNIISAIKRWRMSGACSTYGTDEKCIQSFHRRPEGKRSLGRPRRRWKDNVRIDHREIGWRSMDWMHVAQDRD
jgi:hypothetical protein